jgi:dUTP pyrophosphatase
MYPRSSVSKTPLRLANSTGIIDSGYRGHLMGMFDVLNTQTQTKTQTKRQINNNQDTDPDPDPDFVGQQFDRFLQICAPGLVPILVEVVDDIDELGEETERGAGGFGSTGR